MKKRGIISDKEELEARIKTIAQDCTDLTTLKNRMVAHGIEPYARGKKVLTGAWLGKRRYRLTTLGISKEHFRAMSKEEDRLKELQKQKNKRNTRDHEKD